MKGIMNQDVGFPVEVVVGDDFSNDNTLDIIKKFRNTENIQIKILEREPEDSYWRKRQKMGRLYNFTNIIENCSGKYIALLDGDDCWTDPNKLQKQVDFLEDNIEFVVTHHDAEVINEKGAIIKKSQLPKNSKKIYDSSELLKGAGMVTSSMVFRNIFLHDEIPPEFYHAFGGDRFLASILGLYGKAFLIVDIKNAQYRIHQGGVDGSYSTDSKSESELRQMEDYLSTRIAIYLFLRRKQKRERYSILFNDILPRLLQIYKKKYSKYYLLDRIKKKLHL